MHIHIGGVDSGIAQSQKGHLFALVQKGADLFRRFLMGGGHDGLVPDHGHLDKAHILPGNMVFGNVPGGVIRTGSVGYQNHIRFLHNPNRLQGQQFRIPGPHAHAPEPAPDG